MGEVCPGQTDRHPLETLLCLGGINVHVAGLRSRRVVKVARDLGA